MLENDHLVKLTSLAFTQTESASRMTDIITSTHSQILASVGNAPGYSYTEALYRCAALLGFADQAALEADLRIAAAKDDTANTVITITVAGGEEIIGAVPGAGFLTSVAADFGEEHAREAWANNYATALDNFWTAETDGRTREGAAHHALSGLVDKWVPEDELARARQSDDEYLEEIFAFYDLRTDN